MCKDVAASFASWFLAGLLCVSPMTWPQGKLFQRFPSPGSMVHLLRRHRFEFEGPVIGLHFQPVPLMTLLPPSVAHHSSHCWLIVQ